MQRLNLASGQRPFKGWTNIDIRKQDYPIDIVADIRELDMFDNDSCDVLVAHHVVEHFDMSEVGGVAKEWWRVLKSGGRLAVFVPDMKEITKAWMDGRINDYIFNVNVYGAYQGYLEDLHRWSYYYDYLIQQMSQEIKWDRVGRFTRETMMNPVYNGADIAFDFWILGVEFIK